MGQWVNRYAHLERKVGGGFYALRENRSASGKVYTKLVKADRSPTTRYQDL